MYVCGIPRYSNDNLSQQLDYINVTYTLTHNLKVSLNCGFCEDFAVLVMNFFLCEDMEGLIKLSSMTGRKTPGGGEWQTVQSNKYVHN